MNDPGDPPSFCRTATAPSLCWLPESVRGRLLHAAASASRPQSPASHFQSKRRASTRGRAELAPTTLAAASKAPHLKAWLTVRGCCNLCWAVLRARGPKSDLQVRVPSLPLGSCVTWSELLNLSVPRFYHLSKGRKIVSISWGGCGVKWVKIKH